MLKKIVGAISPHHERVIPYSPTDASMSPGSSDSGKELYLQLADVLEGSIQRSGDNKGVGKCYWMDGA